MHPRTQTHTAIEQPHTPWRRLHHLRHQSSVSCPCVVAVLSDSWATDQLPPHIPAACHCLRSQSFSSSLSDVISTFFWGFFFAVCLPLCLFPKILFCWMAVERLLYPLPSYITSGTGLCWQLHGHWFKVSKNGEFYREISNYNDFYRLKATSTQTTELAIYPEQ